MDALASEYAWPIEYIMELPTDVTAQLIHAILHRKGVRTRLTTVSVDEQAEPLAGRLSAIWGKIDKDE